MLSLKNQRVTIVGAKRSGMALARLVRHWGGIPRMTEQASMESLPADDQRWLKSNSVLYEFSGHTQKFVEETDWLVLSPGVRLDSLPAQWALAKHIPVLGEIEFAFQFCTKPVIAVTGSNGKTTTVTLIQQVLEKAGYRSSLCGNIGSPFSDHVFESDNKDFFVLEISSFQLETTLNPSVINQIYQNRNIHLKGFKPHIAVILNFSQNHLDRHKDLQEYLDAKIRIFIHQDKNDFAVLNDQSPHLKEAAKGLKGQVVFFDAPQDPDKKDAANPNQLAVIKVANILGIPRAVCLKVFEEFKGVEHRMEWVRSLHGVDYVNDSKATTAEAGRWALTQIHRPIVMICGGRDKNIDFSVLSELVQSKVRRMVVFGEARAKLKKTFESVVPIEECVKLDEAVARAQAIANQGDCVILTPMCTSFDLFASYEERGRVYKQIVQTLR